MTLTLAVLGDSIAYGQGAGREVDTAGARLATTLTAAGFATRLQVLAVPGARSEGLAAQVTRARPLSPDIALIIIGANDLTHFVPPHLAAALLSDAVRTLRDAGAQVVVAPAPDMSAIPGVPAQLRPLVRAASTTLRQAQTSAALASGARVADLDAATSAAFAADPDLCCGDRFHPSSAGYALIAHALTSTMLAAANDVLGHLR